MVSLGKVFQIFWYAIQTEAIFLKFFFSRTSWPDERPRPRRLLSTSRRCGSRCSCATHAAPSAAHALPRREPARSRRAGVAEGDAAAQPPQESSEANPATRGPETSGFTFPFFFFSFFFNSANGPQPTGPGCSAGQSACGVLGKVEGGDVSGNSCLRSGRRRRASSPATSQRA